MKRQRKPLIYVTSATTDERLIALVTRTLKHSGHFEQAGRFERASKILIDQERNVRQLATHYVEIISA